MTMAIMRTRGEEVFAEYLDSLGMKFTYEPSIGQSHPDFLVHAPKGDVLCEVKDFELNDEDRAELNAALAGHSAFGSREVPFGRIRRRIRRASEKCREFKGRYPCLVVLFDASAMVHLIDLTVLAAMYGNARISMAVDVNGSSEAEPSTVFARESRYLTRDANTTVSAVAILEYVTPKQRLLEEALSAQRFADSSDAITAKLKFIYDFSESHPEVFDRVPRLLVFQNIFAAMPWPREALNGPHDLLWPAGGHPRGA